MSAGSRSASADGALRIVVTGLIAQHPELGGMTWHYLHYLLGLADLGHDVHYLEDSGELPYSLRGNRVGMDAVPADCSANVEALRATLDRFGFDGRWAYHCASTSEWFGMSDSDRTALLRSADLLVNVSGSLVHPEHYRDVPCLAYIDTDPIVTQAKIATRPEFRHRVEAHDIHFSFGETLDAPEDPFAWIPTRQPIVLSEWEPAPRTRNVYTTVMNWTSYAPVVHDGRTHGQKDVELRRFLDLPTAVGGTRLEIALGGTRHAAWESEPGAAVDGEADPAALLRDSGWEVVDARVVAGDLDRYRNYIRESRGEWSVAKHAYVAGSTGWFSERSACYLAAGRPVVVQDTGFTRHIPTGEGVVTFQDLLGAAAAIATVEDDYVQHSEAARAVAESHFAADTVLGRLIAEAMGDRAPASLELRG